MPTTNTNFENLEKQLAKDALEKALRDLHGEIIKDIDKNKSTFSQEIQKTLNDFKVDLENTLSKELDQKISAHWQKHFLDISAKVTSSFYENSSPLLKRAEEDMTRLHTQGESTLNSWKTMMQRFQCFWNKPFILTFLSASFAGTVIFFVCASFLWIKYTQEIKSYERQLTSHENMLLWYFEKYQEHTEALKGRNHPRIAGLKPKTKIRKQRSNNNRVGEGA